MKLPNMCYEKEELNLLAQHTAMDRFSFSAAGFFDINISFLLSLFGCVTSHLIIIIQINQIK